MLFNSYTFLLAFLPITLIGFFGLGRLKRPRAALAWLLLCSLGFYAWWNPGLAFLIMVSIVFNFAAGGLVTPGALPDGQRKAVLVSAIAANLGLLGYYKYAGFFLSVVDALSGAQWRAGDIVLPLAISFFTFTQITFLVDSWKGGVRERDFLRYCLFVLFFPHLIAGPIVHHHELMPQFNARSCRPQAEFISAGALLFAIGLFKKVLIADWIAGWSDPVFAAAGRGDAVLTLFEGWLGALSYTLQIYFDFSGYSDMAVGLALLFGIVMPLNFASPYKATSIIEFWRRWHMTLSRFLRDYLYIPLGGGRRRRWLNLMTVMVLGGLWHGAGWTFVLWGALHGVYLLVNHGFRALCSRFTSAGGATWHSLALIVTFLAVVVAWVPFRAPDLDAAIAVWKAMAGVNGAELGQLYRPLLGGLAPAMEAAGIRFDMAPYFQPRGALAVVVLLVLVWIAPNAQQIVAAISGFGHLPAEASPRLAHMAGRWPAIMWCLGGIAMALGLAAMGRSTQFLYFQF